MGNLHKELENCKHPNSRKTKVLSKKAKHVNNRQKVRLGHAIKSNIIGEKLAWFGQKLEGQRIPLNPNEFTDLIKEYLKRFDKELEQIRLKQSISKNRSKQHVAREDVIKFTLEKEKNDFYGGGLELLNLCDEEQCKSLLAWDGNAINVQHFKLSLISENSLSKLVKDAPNNEETIKYHENPKIIITSYCDDNENMIIS